jgi:hypothetical protein
VPTQSWFRRFIKKPIGVLITIIVGCAAIYGAWGPFWPTAPVVEVDGLDTVVVPLQARFSIRNRSFFFPIRITSLGCEITRMEPLTVGDVDVIVSTNVSDYTIPPSETRPMRCKVEGGQRRDITRIEIKVLLRYEFPWLSWLHIGRLDVTPLHWTPNHWSKGEVMQ